MAIDQNPPTPTLGPDPSTAEVIDNELPAYRAISPGAILTLLLGLGSVFCFTSLTFLLVVAAAIVVGLLSLRKIRRLPDVLTGAIFARVGIALALAFGLSSVTHLVASGVLVKLDASRFAKQYAEVLKSQSINVALWYGQPTDYRKSKNPDELAEELKKVKSPAGMPDPTADKIAILSRIKERLRGPGEQIHYAKIESTFIDGLTVYANALVELDGPGGKDRPEEEFALVELVKGPGGGPNDWMVKELRYPYKPASAAVTVVKKADDGHGHSH